MIFPAKETLAMDEAAISSCGSSIMWRHVLAPASEDDEASILVVAEASPA